MPQVTDPSPPPPPPPITMQRNARHETRHADARAYEPQKEPKTACRDVWSALLRDSSVCPFFRWEYLTPKSCMWSHRRVSAPKSPPPAPQSRAGQHPTHTRTDKSPRANPKHTTCRAPGIRTAMARGSRRVPLGQPAGVWELGSWACWSRRAPRWSSHTPFPVLSRCRFLMRQ